MSCDYTNEMKECSGVTDLGPAPSRPARTSGSRRAPWPTEYAATLFPRLRALAEAVAAERETMQAEDAALEAVRADCASDAWHDAMTQACARRVSATNIVALRAREVTIAAASLGLVELTVQDA